MSERTCGTCEFFCEHDYGYGTCEVFPRHEPVTSGHSCGQHRYPMTAAGTGSEVGEPDA